MTSAGVSGNSRPRRTCSNLGEYQSAEWWNPAYSWCYPDEDLVGLMIEIAETAHPTTMAITALVKWLILSFDVEASDE